MSERRTSGIVTPEAVLLEFETAGIGSRALARLVDLVVQAMAAFLLLTLIGMVVGAVGFGDPGLLAGLIALFGMLVVFGYPIGLETWWRGRTVGKVMLGIRVVTREGAPIRFRHAAIRGLIGFVEVIAFQFVAVLSTLISPANQRIGDLTAGTIVVRERSADRTAMAMAFPPPPGWEPYARTLDVSAVTVEQYRLIRSFLLRVTNLAPDARNALAQRLANPVALAMRHQPPPQVGPELFLVCTAAAYQVRHGLGGWPFAPPPPSWPWPATGQPPGWGSAPAGWPVPPPPAFRR
jgi:uncharacterized RDD family membrane protein YckC